VVNRRTLRTIDPGTFKDRVQNAKSLRAAMDDGFEDYTVDGVDRRSELKDREMLILGWQLRARGNNREVARVWALVETDTSDVLKVKFYDASAGNILHPGIAITLRDMEDNGTTGDVRVVFRTEDYSFFGDDGGTVNATRYWIEDVNPDDESARRDAEADSPDF
jgi:hypothetical protein